MKLPRLRVRTYMRLVCLLAILFWLGMTGLRYSNCSRLAAAYDIQERYYRERARRDLAQGKAQTIEARWGLRIAEYYGSLAKKYRRAMWRPWVSVSYEPLYFDPEQLPASPSP